MGFRGQTPKSRSKHKRDGTFRADRHAALVDDSDFNGDLPERPADLSADELAVWDHVVETTPEGVLRLIDESELIGLCFWYGEYRRAIAAMRGMRITAKAYYRTIQLAAIAWKHFAAAASRFGMTPADRARLKIAPSKPKDDGDALENLKLVGAKAS
jgi:P27 family predicted phage terminase small subunit